MPWWTPPLGLLLDVDGPIASPVTRTVATGILDDLRTLLAVSIPVVLNTGRSADFVTEHVLGPLVGNRLPAAARLHAVGEKGGVWTSAGPDGVDPVHVDPALRVPGAARAALEDLVRDGYGDVMFVDRSKVVMTTAEARTDVPNETYRARQVGFVAELATRLRGVGLRVRQGEERYPDTEGRTPWRIDPSVIATDVESDESGKALGARRALDLLAGDGPLPLAWHTLGDSRSDYAMADELHRLGHAVTHVDVGPQPALAGRRYPVTTVPGLVDDAAGAAHLRALVAELAP